MAAHHYVCVHASSDHSLYRMTYYIYRGDMVAHHYVCADIPGKEMRKYYASPNKENNDCENRLFMKLYTDHYTSWVLSILMYRTET